MRQYSIDQVEAGWLGLDLKEGLAEGASITETRNAPDFTQKITGNGKAVRVYGTDKSGQLAVVIDQESQTHQSLLAIANSEDNPGTRDKVATFVLADKSSGYTMNYENAYIAARPDEVRGTESSTFTWLFNFESIRKEPIADPTNLVGN